MADNTAKDKATDRKATPDRVSETPDKGVSDPGEYEDFRTEEKRQAAKGRKVTHPEYEDPYLVTPPVVPGAEPSVHKGYETK